MKFKSINLIKMKKIISIIILSLFSLMMMGTEIDVNPVADSYVQGGSSNGDVNFGSETLLWVKNNASTSFARKTIFKFDLSEAGLIPSGETITEVKFKFTFEYIDKAGIEVQAYAVADDSWVESFVTWNNLPEVGEVVSEIFTTPSGSSVPLAVELDLTEYVLNEYLNDANKLISFVIYSPTAGNHIKLSSKEGSVVPQLHITSAEITNPAAPSTLQVSALSAQVAQLSWKI